jgi:hypothetical protein
MNHNDEGLGLSVAIYAFAMVCGLGLCVLPIYWANSPTVYDNPGVTALHRPGGPSYGNEHAEFPLARLHRQQIVSPSMLAELNAKAQKQAPAVRHASRPARRSYAQAQDTDVSEPRPASRLFPFSLF